MYYLIFLLFIRTTLEILTHLANQNVTATLTVPALDRPASMVYAKVHAKELAAWEPIANSEDLLRYVRAPEI